MAIGIAILGAGIFASEEHLPAIQKCSSLSLKAIYSHDQKSAEKLAKEHNVDIYYEDPPSEERCLKALLERSDVHAVTIALPITIQHEFVKKALAAGKHVLSEKPIAKDIHTAKTLIEWHSSLASPPMWAVGENFRFLNFTVVGADKVRAVGGDVVTFHGRLTAMIGDDDKFYNTEWRKFPSYQGGFCLDGGIHFIAATRFLLAAAGEKVVALSAFTTQLQKKLPPIDTIHSIWRLGSGNSGTFIQSWGTEHKGGMEFEVVTTKGRITVNGDGVVVSTKNSAGEKVEDKTETSSTSGVGEEIAAFARGIEEGKLDQRQTPEEALADLLLLENMLNSGKEGGALKTLAY